MLESLLAESLSWRKQELQQARFLAEQSNDTSRSYLCRAWTLVMYAHCDQYLKEASRLYLEHLGQFPREGYDYWSVWQAFRAKDVMLFSKDELTYERALRPQEIDKSILLEAIRHKMVLDSGSFRYERLRFVSDFVLQIDFESQNYKGFCTTLKTKRDEIAHGEQSYVNDVADCLAWHVPTLKFLDELTDAVMDSIASG